MLFRSRNVLLRKLVDSLYSRNEIDFKRGTFRVTGDTVDIFPAYSDLVVRVTYWGEDIEEIETIDPVNWKRLESFSEYVIYPANIFVTTRERINSAIENIQNDLWLQTAFFKETGKHEEAKRLEQRVLYDLEMIKELGYCSGIENYSRYFDGRDRKSVV